MRLSRTRCDFVATAKREYDTHSGSWGCGMVLAYHLIISAYGFWLPNDERGSWSQFVRAYELARFGPATKVTTRRSVAHPYNPARRRAMKAALARAPVRFTGLQARAIARGFADYCARTGCIIPACAVLPDHAHLVVARHRILIERTCERLKSAATTQLLREGLHPFADEAYANGRLPTPWARKGWWCSSIRTATSSVPLSTCATILCATD